MVYHVTAPPSFAEGSATAVALLTAGAWLAAYNRKFRFGQRYAPEEYKLDIMERHNTHFHRAAMRSN